MYLLRFKKTIYFSPKLSDHKSVWFHRDCDSYEYSIGGIILSKNGPNGTLETIEFISYNSFDSVTIEKQG